MPAALLAAGLLLALSSCATAPRWPVGAAERVSNWFGVLPEGDTFYLAADLAASRGALVQMLAQAGFREKSLGGFFERTDRVYASVRLGADAAPDISLVALGRYPRQPTNFYLWTRKEWKQERGRLSPTGAKSPSGTQAPKVSDRRDDAASRAEVLEEDFCNEEPRSGSSRGGFLYWVHRGQGLQVAVPQDGVILAAQGSVERLAERLQPDLPSAVHPFPLPEEAARDLEEAALGAYFPELPPAVRAAWSGRLPIGQVWLAARPRSAGYELDGVFSLKDARNPRQVESLFRLLVTVWLRGARVENLSERLKSVRVAAGPDAVRVTGLVFTLEELTRSLQAFITGGGGGG